LGAEAAVGRGQDGQRQQSAEARTAVERAVHRMQSATTADDVWRACSGALDSLALDFASLQLFAHGASPHVLVWPEHPDGDPDPSSLETDTWTARLRVQNNGHLFGELELRKSVRYCTLIADAPELVDRLRREMAHHFERVATGEAEVSGASALPGRGWQ